MDEFFVKVNRISKKSPKQIRYITLYNIVNFWASLILSVIAFIFFILVLPLDELTFGNLLTIAIILIVIVSINFFILKITLNFVLGSMKAYWILLIFFFLQCISIQTNNGNFEFALGGIPLTIRLPIEIVQININLIAAFFTIYLIVIKEKYYNYLQLPEEERKYMKTL